MLLASYSVDELPSPPIFWAKHVDGFTPAYFPGLARSHPAYIKWATDAALAKEYGHFDVKTEPKHEERLSDHCASHASVLLIAEEWHCRCQTRSLWTLRGLTRHCTRLGGAMPP